MFQFFRIPEKWIINPGKSRLHHSFEILSAYFARGDRKRQIRSQVIALTWQILEENGTVPESRLAVLRRLLEEKTGVAGAEEILEELRQPCSFVMDDSNSLLLEIPQEKRRELIRFELTLAQESGVWNQKNHDLLKAVSDLLLIPQEEFEQMVKTAQTENESRKKLLRSSAGLLAALGVIAVFVLTATLLKSVIFGLIGAYLLLPLEKYFERKLRSRKGIIFYITRGFEICSSPLFKLSSAVQRRRTDVVRDPAREYEARLIRKAVLLTALLLAFVAISAGVFASAMTGKYVVKIKDSVQEIKQTAADSGETQSSLFLERAGDYVEQLKLKVANVPVVHQAVELIQSGLKNENTRNEISGWILRSTGGVVNFTAGMLGTIAAIAGDVVLSVFFGLLFLIKLASFCRTDSSSKRQSEYLIRTVFNGKWLPGANENTIQDARRILSGTFDRLRIWVKGYISLMLIDALVYTVIFRCCNVPYFFLLGPLAGCGILLPYIGPILGFSTTVLVTLAVGNVSGAELFCLMGCYLIYAGIIEQFILYPAVIGESLGLTTLETIIVVLLGAVFAGISGMILALPAASVLKFIVPQIYRLWHSEEPLEKKNSGA